MARIGGRVRLLEISARRVWLERMLLGGEGETLEGALEAREERRLL